MRAQADLFARYMDLWKVGRAARRRRGGRAGGRSRPRATSASPIPDWSANPVFDVIKQSYLITSDWLNDLVGGVEGVDPMTKRRVEFFTKMLTDAFSPSNFLLSNPAALREAMQTQRREPASRAWRTSPPTSSAAAASCRSARPTSRQFKVGENVATAPGKVIFQNELIQILQFAPTTETVCEIPLLIFPPWINKFYILDLRPENSMIRWLTGQGFTVFVTSWVNPDPRLADQDLRGLPATRASTPPSTR